VTRVPVVLPVIAGIVVGVVVSLVQSTPYRATTTVAVTVKGAPAAVPTVAELAKSDAVVDNVARATHLSADAVRAHLHVSVVPKTALIRLRFEDAARLRAEQIAQQEAIVLQAIVASRFGASTKVVVVDPARAEREGHPVLPDALWGALAGALLGLVLRSVKHAPRRERVPEPAPAADARPLVAEPAAPAPAPSPPPPPPPRGRVAELREALDARRDGFSADQVAEWEAYLVAFEAQEVDGRLPPKLEGMVRDVFEPLLQ
jgi:capsular polysaccharide biosynthesis protein